MKTIHRKNVWVLKIKDYDLDIFETVLCAVNETKTEVTDLTTGKNISIKVKPYPKEEGTFQSARPKYKERYFLSKLENEARGLVSEFSEEDQNYIANNEILSIEKIKDMQTYLNQEFYQAKHALEESNSFTLNKK